MLEFGIRTSDSELRSSYYGKVFGDFVSFHRNFYRNALNRTLMIWRRKKMFNKRHALSLSVDFRCIRNAFSTYVKLPVTWRRFLQVESFRLKVSELKLLNSFRSDRFSTLSPNCLDHPNLISRWYDSGSCPQMFSRQLDRLRWTVSALWQLEIEKSVKLNASKLSRYVQVLKHLPVLWAQNILLESL